METLPEVDPDRILGSSPWLDRAPVHTATIISPYTCKPRQQKTLRGLLEEIIADVGQRTLNLATSMNAALELAQADKIRLVMPGYTSHDVYFQKLLQKRGVEYSVMSHGDHLPSGPSRQGSGLVAVVGMSGRFPGSGDINAFWEGLLEGKRYIQEVRFSPCSPSCPLISYTAGSLTHGRFQIHDLTWSNGTMPRENKRILPWRGQEPSSTSRACSTTAYSTCRPGRPCRQTSSTGCS